ncbi:MAG: GIY-YIG nuclease family protein, partial [Candidatus Komeilibacteria bacterium]|nr:GIY-YIG nuclease family protein [Candidatus Komeilibacteria bacterium]
MTASPKKLGSIPRQPGIYQFFDEKNKLLYIGKAKNLHSRVRSYFQRTADLSPAKQQMVVAIKHIKYTIVNNETEALLLEKTLIRKEQPPYNIDLRDDKYWLYIKIDRSGTWPYVTTTRRFEPANKVRFFGPFISGLAVRRISKLLRRVFPFRLPPDYKTELPKDTIWPPTYFGHYLTGTESEIKEQYEQILHEILDFLNGNTAAVIKEIKAKMKGAVTEQNYELAKVYRDQIQAVEALKVRQDVVINQNVDEDFISLYKDSGKSFINLFKVRRGKL